MRFMCVVVPGLEEIVEDDLINSLPNIHDIKTERGKIFFDIDKENLNALLNIKSVDNFYYFISSFKVGICKKDLVEFKKEILKLKFDKICKFVDKKLINSKLKNENLKIIVSASKKGKANYSRFDISEIATSVLVEKYNFTEGDSKNYDIAIRIDIDEPTCNIFTQITDASFKFRGTNYNFVRGGLRPTISYTLLKIAKIKKDDVFLDPFCGSGTIPIECVNFRARKIYASDIDSEVIAFAKENAPSNVHIYLEDATKLSFKDKFIDVIVSNIPWGKQVMVDNISLLYNKFLKEAKRVLKDNGRMVLLTDKDELLKEAIILKFNVKVITTLSLHGLHPKVYYLTKE